MNEHPKLEFLKGLAQLLIVVVILTVALLLTYA